MCQWLARYACLLALVCAVSLYAREDVSANYDNTQQRQNHSAPTHSASPYQLARPPLGARVNARFNPSLSADADLQLKVEVERTSVQPRSNYAYSLTVSNAGPATATTVKLTSQLPIGMSYIIANPSQGSCFNSNGAITCNLGSVAVNAPVFILIGVTLNDRATAGSALVYTASVSGEQNDPSPDNNRITVTTTVSGKPTIAGRVSDIQGNAVANVTLNATGATSAARTTDAQGNFAFDDLASGGNYTITPSRQGFWFEPAARQIPELLEDQTANFVANPCNYSVSPTTINIPSGGGNASVTVTTTSRCPWTASSQNPWIAITGGLNSTGSGQLNFNVASTAAPRTGRIIVAGQEISIYQVANSCPVPAFRQGTLLTQDVPPESQTFAADFNNDGLSELVVIGPAVAGVRPVSVYSLEDNGNGWREWSELRAPAGTLAPAAADFNRDGKNDLLLVNVPSTGNATAQLYLSNGQGGWDLPDRFAVSLRQMASMRQVFTRDLNNDRRPDIVVEGSGGAFITLSQGTSGFAAPTEINLGNDSLLAVADFTGDGGADYLTGAGAQLRVRIGGTGAPIESQLDAPFVLYGVADFNGDNRADLLMGKDRLSDGTLLVMLSQGNGRFAAPIAAPGNLGFGNGGYQVFLDDFNNDARMDVMLIVGAANRQFLAGDGAGRLAAPITIALPFESRSLVAGRFTRDTSLDLFALGQGQFANQLQLFTSECGVATLMIYGRVTEGNSNRGIVGATLRLSGNKSATVATDIGGYYEFGNLPARFGYVVTADEGEFSFTPPKAENSYLTKDQQFNFQARRRLNAVSAASYQTAIAPDSIISLFGLSIAPTTQVATTSPLPETLGNTNISFTDAAQRTVAAKLFFVSPNQINLLVPGNLTPGNAKLIVQASSRADVTSTVRIDAVAPGLFTSDASGRGLPAAVVLRVSATGRQTYESIARWDAVNSKFVAVPIDLSNTSDQVFLLLYGTGMRYRSALNNTMVSLGGTEVQPLYVGPQGLAGLDQINVRIPTSLRGRGDINVNISVDGKTSNTVTLNIR
jgi:uncharacterized protein (TIGR03437 family)